MKETLRLYTPTKRVYHQYPGNEKKSADVEECHRTKLLAAERPHGFIPDRWLHFKKKVEDGEETDLKEYEQKLGFMPFALICPADGKMTQGFGMKMIALLVCAIVEGLDALPGKWNLQAGDDGETLPSPGTAMNSGREDYLSLVYKKDESQEKAVDGKGKKLD